jgi:hypothetical protein
LGYFSRPVGPGASDVVLREDGVSRVVESGDGQVSDLVGWSPEAFAAMWAGGVL